LDNSAVGQIITDRAVTVDTISRRHPVTAVGFQRLVVNIFTCEHVRTTVADTTQEEVQAGLLTASFLWEGAECFNVEAVILVTQNDVYNAGNSV